MWDLLIVGTGPAGVSAALTAKTRGLSFLWFGSQRLSDKVEKAERILNYPGLPQVPSRDTFGQKVTRYKEGLYVGYRYYDTAGVPVRFPFGYGLSYTRFAYSDLTVKNRTARVTVTNIGDCPGAEVAQLYIAPPRTGLYRPAKELKGFARVYLTPGESRTVDFPLDDRSFAIWSDGWKVPAGTYTLLVGSSSADIRLQQEIEVPGADLPAPAWQAGSWYETLQGLPTDDVRRTVWQPAARRPAAGTGPLLNGGLYHGNEGLLPPDDASLPWYRSHHCAGIWRESGLQQPGFPHDDYVRRRRAASCSGALQRRQLPGRGGAWTGGSRQRADGWAGVIGQPSPSARARQGQLRGLWKLHKPACGKFCTTLCGNSSASTSVRNNELSRK